MKRLISLMMFLFLTGCAEMQDRNTVTPQDKQLQQDRRLTTYQGAVTGAAGGAVAGALAGQAFGRSTKSTLIGAGVGAVGGAIIGRKIGKDFANKKERYAKKEDYLNSRIENIRQINGNMMAYNGRLAQDIRDLNNRINILYANVRSKSSQRAALLNEQRYVEAKFYNAQEELRNLRALIDKERKYLYSRQRNSQEAYTLDAEIRKLEQTAKKLELHASTLATINHKIKS